MKLTRFTPLVSLAAGAAIAIAATACGGGGDSSFEGASPSPAADTATSSATATATATPTLTPTPTPTPFAGPIARLKIPRFGVDAPIEELGLIESRNELDTPKDENRSVGWYYIYDRPGWGGNAVFSAHVYYHNVPAPFVNLAQSVDGDEVVVEMENGTEYRYKVISNERYHRDTIPMGEIIWPQNRNGKEWITLITCGGELDSTGQEYISRDVIIAERVS